jgi:hypothetical protein
MDLVWSNNYPTWVQHLFRCDGTNVTISSVDSITSYDARVAFLDNGLTLRPGSGALVQTQVFQGQRISGSA